MTGEDPALTVISINVPDRQAAECGGMCPVSMCGLTSATEQVKGWSSLMDSDSSQGPSMN